ncbi:unnamed protein product [Rotaria magnacalcarata]|uniref:Protein-S-isoprenylcysteine O-methyltransferase n=2 Tax=Rotaria magnacalcarata TaxID=392030 RepID=A0A815QXS2_9BILA|nr:unnamed protein product [Rotaria magnacalcarata]CAF1572334.1 unnamed protein product [Rotaria magnacalcarata]CAF3911333.1 unnamed protein product [Rotaria magnacalcarata]CAF3953304.1 unnamed protein product [Rotaria magnacalcarata]
MESISYDILPLLQLFLLIFTTLLFHIGINNPNLSSTGDHVPAEGVDSRFAVFIGPKLGKFLIWIYTLYEVLYLYLQAFSPASISTFSPQILASINPLPLIPISVMGYMLMIIGGLGRIWCYKTLGVFFTFELAIRSSHKLIKTGPYSYVRHPSYTFACILTIGLWLVHQRLTNFFPKRVTREEEELAKAFGKEWTVYALKTKRFIPKII